MPYKNPEDIIRYRQEHRERYLEHNRKWHSIKGSYRLFFKGKFIRLKFNPRTGVCSQCNKQGVTHLHHTQYDDLDPLKYTIELCPSCHAKITWRLESVDCNNR